MSLRLGLLAALGAALLTSPASAQVTPPELMTLEAKYNAGNLARRDDGYRREYVMKLAQLRWNLVQKNKTGWQAVDAEIARHPMRPTNDPAVLAAFKKARVGTWYSPRHDYLYRADGTWKMDPAASDDETTIGLWDFHGNAYGEKRKGESKWSAFLIILLDDKTFIFLDPATKDVFYETTSLTRGLPLRRP